MLTVEEALAKVAEAVGSRRCRTEQVDLDDALGRVLAADVRMDHDMPPFPQAAMDGFAVAGAPAVGATLEVVATVPAGTWPEVSPTPGQAVRIMTGAPVPPGATRVIPFEWTRAVGDRVTLERLPSDASHIVAQGAHVRAGDVVLPEGRRLHAGALGALATAGQLRVQVAIRPRVAVLGTGTELAHVASTPEPGQVRNSNTALLRAQARRTGADAVDLGLAVDDEEELRWAIRKGLGTEVLVLSGGVSRGDLDLVPAALEAEGVRQVFHRWRVQPGGPLWFGRHERSGTLVFGLPGNPAASFVGFEILVVPAILGLLGLPVAARRTFRARYVGPVGPGGDRRRYRPVRLESADDGGLVAKALPWTGSGDPFLSARAEALAVLPDAASAQAGPSGPVVEVLPLDAWA